jgi:hypothetical protein
LFVSDELPFFDVSESLLVVSVEVEEELSSEPDLVVLRLPDGERLSVA